jgi:predicted GTPase
MGYGEEQLAELAATIAAVSCDVVVTATPVDLRRYITINRDVARVTYELRERPLGAFDDVVLTAVSK